MISARSVPACLLRLAAAVSIVLPVLAGAETLYNQPFAETANGGYWASTLGGYLQHDSFTLATDATVSSVGWYGVDLNELVGWTPINPTSFTLSIAADDGSGAPGEVLSFSTIGASAGATDTGQQLLGLTLYHYTGTLETAFHASAGTTYWLGVSDPTDNGNWFWASGAGPDGNHVGVIGGVPDVYEDDMSFSLDGTISAVPEPSTVALFALGAIGLFGVRARRAR